MIPRWALRTRECDDVAVAIRRRTSEEDGRAAVTAWRAAAEVDAGEHGAATVPRPVLATAVRWSLEELATRAPGRSVEVRVPPFAAVQCVAGPTHTRGTPPAVVETDAQTWLALATGALPWADALADGALRVSGQRADLAAWLPLA